MPSIWSGSISIVPLVVGVQASRALMAGGIARFAASALAGFLPRQ